MTLGELKELLQCCEDCGVTDDAEVRIATQPSYPFENSVRGVKVRGSNDSEIEEISDRLHTLKGEERKEAESELHRQEEENEQIVYLLEGSQICYGSKDLWENML